jgi:hypothetical protein
MPLGTTLGMRKEAATAWCDQDFPWSNLHCLCGVLSCFSLRMQRSVVHINSRNQILRDSLFITLPDSSSFTRRAPRSPLRFWMTLNRVGYGTYNSAARQKQVGMHAADDIDAGIALQREAVAYRVNHRYSPFLWSPRQNEDTAWRASQYPDILAPEWWQRHFLFASTREWTKSKAAGQSGFRSVAESNAASSSQNSCRPYQRWLCRSSARQSPREKAHSTHAVFCRKARTGSHRPARRRA